VEKPVDDVHKKMDDCTVRVIHFGFDRNSSYDLCSRKVFDMEPNTSILIER
jgi:hypothetical protein